MRIVFNTLWDCKSLLQELFCCDEDVYSDSVKQVSEDIESRGGGGDEGGWGEGTSSKTSGTSHLPLSGTISAIYF